MAALYGSLKGSRKIVTRTAHELVWSELETWEGSIVTELEKDGSYRVYVGPKKNARTLIAEGNINQRAAV